MPRWFVEVLSSSTFTRSLRVAKLRNQASGLQTYRRKTVINTKLQFSVIQGHVLRVSGKARTDHLILCINVIMLDSFSKSEGTENRCFRLHHCCLRPDEYPHKTYTARNWSHWATSSLLTVWVYLRSNFRGGLRNMHVLCNVVRNGCSRSSSVIDFGSNRKRVCNFLLVINSLILVLSCPVSEILHGFCWEQRPYLYSNRIFGVIPFD